MDKRHSQHVIKVMVDSVEKLLSMDNDDPKEVWDVILRQHAAIANEIAIRLSNVLT